MLSIFTSKIKEYAEIRQIIESIRKAYYYLSDKRYDLVKDLADNAIMMCNNIKQQSVRNQDEVVANSSFVMKNYLKLLKEYATYWKCLQSSDYRNSWDVLQNCINNLIIVCKFTEKRKSFNLDYWENHLRELEKLYPFRIFASTEMITKDEKCSICGRKITDLDCNHIPGFLYWGEMAHIIVDKAELKAVALVEHPLDKKCVMELQDDNTSKEEKYKLLHYFIQNNQDSLSIFEIEEVPTLYFNDKYQYYKRNDNCPCGSGKKFKKCCGQNKYEKGIHYNIVMKEHMPINLSELSNLT